MDYNQVSCIKLQHCEWIKEHLDDYQFTTDRAKGIREKFEKANFSSPEKWETDEIRMAYMDFVAYFFNDPYMYFAGQTENSGKGIFSNDYSCYFVKNNYDVDVTIGYSKFNKAEFTGIKRYDTNLDNKITWDADKVVRNIEELQKEYGIFSKEAPVFGYMADIVLSGLCTLFAFIDLGILAGIITKTLGTGLTMTMKIVYLLIAVVLLFALGHGLYNLVCRILAVTYNGKLRLAKSKAKRYSSEILNMVRELDGKIRSFGTNTQTFLTIPKVNRFSVGKLLDRAKRFGDSSDRKGRVAVDIIVLILLFAVSLPLSNVLQSGAATFISAGHDDAFVKSILFKPIDAEDYIDVTPIRIDNIAAAYRSPEGAKALGADMNVYIQRIRDLSDGNSETSWQAGAYPMVVTFKFTQEETIDKVRIIVGKNSTDTFKKPKSITFAFPGGITKTCPVNNVSGIAEYSVDLNPPIKADHAAMTIDEFYENSNPNLCITDVEFDVVNKNFD